MKSLAIYCGSSAGNAPVFKETAARMGTLLAERGIVLVYGGGSVGLMGAVADSALAAGGRVIGVIPRFLEERELGHQHLTEMIVVETMHERKQKMIDLAEGFVALPGGYGTLEELSEVLAWGLLGLHGYPCGVVNVEGFYDGLLMCCDRMVNGEFLQQDDRSRLVARDTPEALLEAMAAWQKPTFLKWDHLQPDL